MSKVEFYNGTTKLGEDPSSPYVFDWTNVVSGSYSLTAKVTDNVGGTSTSAQVNIQVAAANAVPTVSITSPAADAVFPERSTVSITANAIDADGTISRVEFFNGPNKLGEDASSPYSFDWTNVPKGTYTLTVKATDNQGGAATSKEVGIAVTAATEDGGPVVTITNPLDKATFNSGSKVTIMANATDASGLITKVEFFNGNSKLGEDTSIPYMYVWNDVQAGKYTLSAKATSATGVSAIDQVEITVRSGPLANAGNDLTVTSPSSSVQMSGMGESSDGSPIVLHWQQASGPNEVSISDDSSNTPTVDNLIEGIYILELTVTDNYGLSGKDRVEIRVSGSDTSADMIPRYFSPNADGINDVWEWPNPEHFANSALTIFNRAGEKIFETDSYQNTWDGTYSGKPLQPDAYYYVIHLSNRVDIKGAVRIVR